MLETTPMTSRLLSTFILGALTIGCSSNVVGVAADGEADSSDSSQECGTTGEPCGDGMVCTAVGNCRAANGEETDGICSIDGRRSAHFGVWLQGGAEQCNCCDGDEFFSGTIISIEGVEYLFSKQQDDASPCILLMDIGDVTVPLAVGDYIEVESWIVPVPAAVVVKDTETVFVGEVGVVEWLWSTSERLGVNLSVVDAGCAIIEPSPSFHEIPLKLRVETPLGDIFELGSGETAELNLVDGSFLFSALAVFEAIVPCFECSMIPSYYMIRIP